MANEKSSKWLYWGLFFATVVIVALGIMLASSIMERRQEKVAKMQMVEPIGENEYRNEIWGKNFPREFDTYLNTQDTTFRSKHGGASMRDYLEEFPNLIVMWAGYGFSKDYNQGRGHAMAVKDIRNTLRTGGVEESPMPATCWSCKSTDVVRMMKQVGPKEFYSGKWIEKGHEIVNPIGCADCHDANTMDLTITRPALVEAMERQGKKIEDFTHNEMRSLVCAQCHVEYYFAKPGNYLTFPWDKGFSADDMEEYYDNIEFTDWTHKLSRTPMLKAQHPDYELFMTGVHAKRGVSCADCHMPYKVEGGVKFTDHHIQSPLANIANACQTCHKESEEQLLKDVYERQDKLLELRGLAEDALAKAHIEAKMAWDAGATEEEMAPVLKLIRHSQWRWDWVAAANGVGFHSPVEAMRVIGTSISKAEKARGILATIFVKHGVAIPVQLPDISTKELAQKYIGLDMEKLRADKVKLLETVTKEWDKEAESRQGSLYKY